MKTATASETATPPPLPWIGDAANTDAAQTWSLPPSVLMVRHRFNAGAYFRLMAFYTLRLWRFYAASLLLIAVAPVAIIGGIKSGSPAPYLLLATITASALAAYLILVAGLTVLAYGASALFLRGAWFRVSLSAQGVERHIAAKIPGSLPVKSRWQDVVAITDWENGFLLEINLGRAPVLVPAEAFADAGAAKRFHDAAFALWQSRGDLSAVPDAVRWEFAPHE